MNLFVCLTILKGQSNEIVDLQFYTVPPSNLLYSTWATDQRVKVFSMLAGNSTLSKKKHFLGYQTLERLTRLTRQSIRPCEVSSRFGGFLFTPRVSDLA